MSAHEPASRYIPRSAIGTCGSTNCGSLTPVTKCTYRGCTERPKWRIVSSTAGDCHWHACDGHRDGMLAAFKVGTNVSAAGPEAEPILGAGR